MGFLDRLSGASLPALSGEGILLRMPRSSDFPSWAALRRESREFLRPWEPAWTTDELTREAYALRLRRYRLDARERTGYTFFLFDPDGTLLGGTTVGQIRRGVAQSCTLGYWMGERFAGRGFMTRAVETLKPFVFDVEGLHRVEAACLPSNARSIALLEKSGFTREGHLRQYLKIAGRWEDHYLYALLAEEWSRSRPSERLAAKAAR
ncbi:GNAT family protein [Aurantimonas sp. Leaf443]|uniref:GNAT family N-acetyltransferase n=1 Tax=Aurantimonas sp. Leaf443 TaxID=1736378 RepID=UPI0006FBDB2B|nr:GNAT family protein [Aurantimonas sp. Leaf443]KQT88080.1 GCN5 family acetyltransferase [Aurantimonas sp. Leaf443]